MARTMKPIFGWPENYLILNLAPSFLSRRHTHGDQEEGAIHYILQESLVGSQGFSGLS